MLCNGSALYKQKYAGIVFYKKSISFFCITRTCPLFRGRKYADIFPALRRASNTTHSNRGRAQPWGLYQTGRSFGGGEGCGAVLLQLSIIKVNYGSAYIRNPVKLLFLSVVPSIVILELTSQTEIVSVTPFNSAAPEQLAW